MQEIIIKSDKWYTYEDYLQLDDKYEYEIIGGKLFMTPKPRPLHQEVVGRLYVALHNFLKQRNIQGKIFLDVDVIFGNQVVSPDIIYITHERLSIISETNIQGPPDLIIEVLSPSTQKYDRKQKSQLYYTNGVKEYWLIDPATQLAEVFAREDKGWYRAGVYDEEDTLVSPLLPELEINLKEIFDVS